MFDETIYGGLCAQYRKRHIYLSFGKCSPLEQSIHPTSQLSGLTKCVCEHRLAEYVCIITSYASLICIKETIDTSVLTICQ